ncbi:cob(I)yrinic acid a,c-diamide adenosyltransferase [Thermodesulfobacteriota bacterium]
MKPKQSFSEKLPMTHTGLIIINTGNGKGKTTAAFGQALRAWGQGLKVCIIQFIKGKWQTGEGKALERLPVDIELHTLGSGFTWESEDRDDLIRTAREGWEFAKDKISSNQYQFIVLDELTYLISYNMIDEREVLEVLRDRPGGMHVMITGRDATEGLIHAADLVTEMREIKHPYLQGSRGMKGIEW